MNSMRSAMNIAREEVRSIGVGRGAGIDAYWLVVSLSAIVLFGCFYVVGHTFNSGAATGGEPPSAQPLASAGVAIPTGLSGAPPIEENTALRLIAAESEVVKPKPRPASASIRTVFKRAPETAPTVTAELPSSTPPAAPSAPVTQSAPAVTEKAPATGGGGGAPQSSPEHTARPSAPAGGGGHSFDSSG